MFEVRWGSLELALENMNHLVSSLHSLFNVVIERSQRVISQDLIKADFFAIGWCIYQLCMAITYYVWEQTQENWDTIVLIIQVNQTICEAMPFKYHRVGI